MNITITFDNANGGREEGIHVYRSNSAFEVDALPAPIATLPPGATQYVDDAVVLGGKYYYRFGIFLNGQMLLSPLITTVAKPLPSIDGVTNISPKFNP
ncbi:MAG TPA: hypothetical protein VF905_10975 [Nitrospirota bacterium]